MEARKPKVFILGISGFLGRHLAERLKDKFLVCGACFNFHTYVPDAQVYSVDFTKPEILEAILRVQTPDFVINCMGIADRALIASMGKVTDNINVLLPVSYAVLANKMRSQFIHLSTVEIYDGEEGPYKEEDYHYTMHEPFGKQKLAAESYIRAQTLESTTLRLGKVMGIGSPYRPTEFDRMRAKLSVGKIIERPKNHVNSYLSVDSFARAVEILISSPFPGKHRIFHVGGANITDFDFYAGWAEMALGNSKLVKSAGDTPKKNFGMKSELFGRTFGPALGGWEPETAGGLYLNLLKALCPGVGIRKWQKTSQIP